MAMELDEKLRTARIAYARASSPVRIEKRAQRSGLNVLKPKRRCQSENHQNPVVKR